jgi:hypothetical protein
MRDLNRNIRGGRQDVLHEDLGFCAAVRLSDTLVPGPHVNDDRHAARVCHPKHLAHLLNMLNVLQIDL